MQVLALDPGSYHGTYKLIGGELSLDFINTISWPDTPKSHDWLNSWGNVIKWASAVGLNVTPGLEAKSNDLNQELTVLNEIRSNLKDILKPLACHQNLTADSMKTLNLLVQRSMKMRYLDSGTHTWRWRDGETIEELLAPVIWNATYIMTELDLKRLKYCGRCEWLFYDKTRNSTRKWCDMADCGARDKSLKYYHRKKGGPDSLE